MDCQKLYYPYYKDYRDNIYKDNDYGYSKKVKENFYLEKLKEEVYKKKLIL